MWHLQLTPPPELQIRPWDRQQDRATGGKIVCVSDRGGNAGQWNARSCETATTAATRTQKHSTVPCHYSIIQHSLSGLQGIPCEHAQITVGVRASQYMLTSRAVSRRNTGFPFISLGYFTYVWTCVKCLEACFCHVIFLSHNSYFFSRNWNKKIL